VPQRKVDDSSEGYSSLRPLFGPPQLGEFAALLGSTPDAIKAPFGRAELAIGPFVSGWAKPAATDAEQRDALNELAADAQSVLDRLRGADSRVRHRLSIEYGRPSEESDTHEEDALAALETMLRDIAGLDRLCRNLAVAQRRAAMAHQPSEGGRPKTNFERFAAAKLLEACKEVLGAEVLKPRSSKKKRHGAAPLRR
jgi:hypothetical protein